MVLWTICLYVTFSGVTWICYKSFLEYRSQVTCNEIRIDSFVCLSVRMDMTGLDWNLMNFLVKTVNRYVNSLYTLDYLNLSHKVLTTQDVSLIKNITLTFFNRQK